MKKSAMFKAAQRAVLAAEFIDDSDKLDIIKVLMDEEYIQKLCEMRNKSEESEGTE